MVMRGRGGTLGIGQAPWVRVSRSGAGAAALQGEAGAAGLAAATRVVNIRNGSEHTQG